jgi:hypothetical protein
MSETIETFEWKGQTRYKCPRKWESGAQCEYNHYDLSALRAHAAEPHTRTGKGVQREVIVSPLLDAQGKQIIRERAPEPEVPAEFEGLTFKDED